MNLSQGWRRLYRYAKQWVAQPWIERFVRLGFAAKGLLYGSMGLITENALRQSNEAAVGTEGTLFHLLFQPFGKAWLGLLMVGLLGYVLWRFIQTVFAPGEPKPTTLLQLVQRLGYALSGLTYGGIAYSAGQLIFDLDVEVDDPVEDFASEALDIPFGPWLIVVGALIVLGVGLGYLYGAFTRSYLNDLNSSIHGALRTSILVIGQIGVTARGISFICVALFLFQAAFLLSPETAGGLEDVFRQLQEQRLGRFCLGAIAAGFIFYALYMFAAALYSKLPFEMLRTASDK